MIRLVTGIATKPWLSGNMLPNIKTCENRWANLLIIFLFFNLFYLTFLVLLLVSVMSLTCYRFHSFSLPLICLISYLYFSNLHFANFASVLYRIIRLYLNLSRLSLLLFIFHWKWDPETFDFWQHYFLK